MQNYTLNLSFIVGFLLASNISSAGDQKMLFNVESISYKEHTGSALCEQKCTSKYNDPPLEQMQKEGWRIVSSGSKEAIGVDYYDYTSTFGDSASVYAFGCTCKGTQYVLEKIDSTPIEASKSNQLLLRQLNVELFRLKLQ